MEELTQDRSASARVRCLLSFWGPTPPLTRWAVRGCSQRQNWIVRVAGAQALGASRHRTQIHVLQALLQEAKPAVRCMGAAAVLRLSRGAPPPASPGPSATTQVRPALDPASPKSSQ
jgi:hypothetical protein